MASAMINSGCCWAFELVDPGDEAQDLRGDQDGVGFQHAPILHPFTPIFGARPIRHALSPNFLDPRILRRMTGQILPDVAVYRRRRGDSLASSLSALGGRREKSS